MYLISFPNYMKILLHVFNGKVEREDIFKLTIWNNSLQEISNYNGIKVVNFNTTKNLIVKSTMFHIATVTNTFVLLLMGKHTIRLSLSL